MLVSQQSKFIFVHIQKTAGISITKVLQQRFPDAAHWHGRHGHTAQGIAEIGRDAWKDYYSFAFVRNPWDRLLSWYLMIEDARAELPIWKRWSKAPFKSTLWNQVVANSDDFESFLDNCVKPVDDRGTLKSFAYNQIDYLTDETGAIAVDYVGRFETLKSHVAEVFDRIHIADAELPRRNASSNGKSHYSARYTPRTRDLVAKRFARDIEAFGYRFEEA